MHRYEGMFLVGNTAANDDWDNLVDHIQGVLTKHGAEVIELNKWEERKLAFNIGDHTRGTYIIVLFNADGSSITKIRHDFSLSESVIRSLILRDDLRKNSLPKPMPATSGEIASSESENNTSSPDVKKEEVAKEEVAVEETVVVSDDIEKADAENVKEEEKPAAVD